MGKILKGIDGERFPIIGNVQEYNVTFMENADIASVKEEEIIWQLYWSNEDSKYEKVPAATSKPKNGVETTYKFLQNLLNKNLQLKASYKDETVELHIIPQSNGEVKIIDVFFLDVEYKAQDKDNLKYLNSLNLQIYTLNMLGKNVDFKIYDTVNGEEKEVYKSEKSLQIIQKNGVVKTKQAITLSPIMPMQTQKDMSASEHIYKMKVWETGNETNFYEEELKVKNEMGKMSVPQDSQVPVKTGTSELVKKKEEEKKEKCFCDKKFAEEDIEKMIPAAYKKNVIKYLDALNKTMKDYEINTCMRKSYFLANLAVESAYLNAATESGKKDSDYGGYKGRGLLQITGKDNYSGYGRYKKMDFLSEKNKQKMAELPYSVDSAGWFFTINRDINSCADEDDFLMAMANINGAFNGYNDRLIMFKKAINYMDVKNKCVSLKGDETLGTYTFEKSKIYNLIRLSFAWGLWNDPAYELSTGFTKNKKEALKGYNKFLNLIPNDFNEKNWLRVNTSTAFKDIVEIVMVDPVKKKTKKNVYIKRAAELRKKRLENENKPQN